MGAENERRQVNGKEALERYGYGLEEGHELEDGLRDLIADTLHFIASKVGDDQAALVFLYASHVAVQDFRNERLMDE